MRHKATCKWFNVCPLKAFYEEGKLDEEWIKEYCCGNYSKCVRWNLEEEGVYHPDNMLPDGMIDKDL